MTFEIVHLHRILAVLCGAWFLPHTYSKITASQARRAEITGFFGAAGLRPPALMVALAGAVELLAACGMIFDFHTRYAALLGGLYLLVATLAVLRVSKARWIWFDRGAEYPALWALVCLLLASTVP